MRIGRDGGLLSRLRLHQLFWTLLLFFCHYFLFIQRSSVAAVLAPAFWDSPIFFFCCYFLFTLGDLCRGCAGTSFFFPLEHTHTHNQRQTHTIIPSLPPSPPLLHLFPPPPSLSTNTIHFDMKIWREFDMDIYRET